MNLHLKRILRNLHLATGTGATGIAVLSLLASTVYAAPKATPAPRADTPIHATDACTDKEAWYFDTSIVQAAQNRFNEYLTKSTSNSVAFSEALALQNASKGFREGEKNDDVAQYFAVYWKYRALYRSGLFRTAFDGFTGILKQPTQRPIVGVQLAALACLNKIYGKYPSLFPYKVMVEQAPQLGRRFQKYAWDHKYRQMVLEALLNLFMAQLDAGAKPDELKATLSLMSKGGPYEDLARGIYAADEKNFEQARRSLHDFLKAPLEAKASGLTRFEDTAHLLLGRAYYYLRDFKKSAEYLNLVSKDSNLMTRVLAELSWVHLMENRLPQAVGAGMNLQTGGFRNVFAPEGLIVMSMAFNELCQYPSSLRSLRFFHQNYKPAYIWLRDWLKQRRGGQNLDLYAALLEAIESGEKKPKIPMHVRSEWLRSPVFLAHQEEINLMHGELAGMETFLVKHGQESKQTMEDIMKLKAKVEKGIKAAKTEHEKAQAAAARAGKSLESSKVVYSEELQANISELRKKRVRFKILRAGAKHMGGLRVRFAKQFPDREKRLIGDINSDLQVRNLVMLHKLSEMAEKAYLIQIDIYQGASQDIVWADANPGFKEFSAELKDQARKAKSNEVWDWGPAPRLADGSAEIWADELGSLAADVTNNCNNKDRFLAVSIKDQQG